MASKQEEARNAIYSTIVDELEKMKQWGTSNTAEVEQLARAYRALVGGSQPGAGCNCTSK